MSNANIKFKCRKCNGIMPGESEEQVCDNCNMNLIAQNLAAELLQHEVYQEIGEEMEDTIETTVDTSQEEIATGETAETLQEEIAISETVENSQEEIAISETVETSQEEIAIGETVETAQEEIGISETVETSQEEMSICETIETSQEEIGISETVETSQEEMSICETIETSQEEIAISETVETSQEEIAIGETSQEEIAVGDTVETAQEEIGISETVETSQEEIAISETVEEVEEIEHIQGIHAIQLPFVDLSKIGDSNEVILESSLASEDIFDVATTSLEIEVEGSVELETEQPEDINQEEEISYQGSDIIIGLEPDNIIEVEEVVECLPSTSSTSPIESENQVTIEYSDRKRKFDETTENDDGPKSKNGDSSDEEPSVKKPDIKPEPMRTRAKVVQEEAAAVKQHGHSMDDDRFGDNEEGDEDDDGKGPMRRLTRKALSEIEKYKHPSYETTQSKSRRTKTFKAKTVYKAPTSQACIYSSDYVFYKGRYYQVGDIVLLRDLRRPGDFFAQVTSFLTDQYCHKCATIQWLFPTKQSPKTGFDPRTYFLGYIDEIPRPLSSLQPVMHLPSDYYSFNKTPYPPPTPDPLKKHFLWKRTEPVSLEEMLQGS